MAKKTNHKTSNIKLSKIVSLLGKILGTVVKEQEGVVLYNKIEEIRDYSGYDYKSSIILVTIEKYFDHPRSVSSCIFKTSSFFCLV